MINVQLPAIALDVHNWASGTYMVSVNSHKGFRRTEKMIVIR
jgi:hypothetical protein